MLLNQFIDEHLITSYLLGTSSAVDTEWLDELSLTDVELVDQLRVAENDLIDCYVRGELFGLIRSSFDSYYLASARRREKVRVAEMLFVFADRESAARDDADVLRVRTENRRKILTKCLSFFSMRSLALQWATCMLFLSIATGYLLLENGRLRSRVTRSGLQLAKLQQGQKQSDQKSGTEPLPQTRVEQHLAQVHEQKKVELKPLSLSLFPQTRGATELARIRVPTGTDYLTLRLELEATGLPTYEASLKKPANSRIIWHSGKLKANENGQILMVRLPTSLLESQIYSLELSSISPGGIIECISSYPFRVVIR